MEQFREFPLPSGVEPVPGESLRYYVRSRSRPSQRYLVDLESVGFNGQCGCVDFEMRHFPTIKREQIQGIEPIYRQCWHIQRAWKYHAALSARIIARHNNKPEAA